MAGLTALIHKAHVYEILLKLMTSVDAYVYLSFYHLFILFTCICSEVQTMSHFVNYFSQYTNFPLVRKIGKCLGI